MEVNVNSFKETVLEVVEVKHHAVHVERCLRIALREVEAVGTFYLYAWQLADGPDQQLLFSHVIATSSLTTTLDGIKQRHVSQIGLQVSQFIVADSQQFRNRQPTTGEMTAEVNERMVLVPACTYTTDNSPSIAIHAIILTIAASSRQTFAGVRLCPTPLLI